MTDPTDTPPPTAAQMEAEDKRKTLLDLLDRDEGLVALHLDARHPGVSVPPHLRGEVGLRLDIAYGFNLPRLVVDEEGVEAVLSFGGRNFDCFLPWDAIFAMSRPRHPGEGAVWAASLPTDTAPHGGDRVDGRPARTSPGRRVEHADEPSAGAGGPWLTVAPQAPRDEAPRDETGDADEPPAPPVAPPPGERRGPTLRLIRGGAARQGETTPEEGARDQGAREE